MKIQYTESEGFPDKARELQREIEKYFAKVE